MRKILIASLVTLFAACTSNAIQNKVVPDAGPRPGSDGGGGGNTGGGGGPDGGGPITPPDNLGTRLIEGKDLRVFGLTEDDHLIYKDSSGTLFSFGLPAGQKATTIASGLDAASEVVIRRNTVFVWTMVNQTSFGGNLAIWNTAGVSVPALASKSLRFRATVSHNGQYLLYTSNISNDGKFADLILAKIDGSGASTVLNQTYVGPDKAPSGFQLGLSSGDSDGPFIIVFTPPVMMGGMPAKGADIAAIDPTTAKLTTLKSLTNGWAPSPDGSQILVRDFTTKAMLALPVGGGGTPTKIDGAFSSATFLSDNRSIAYVNTSNQVLRSTIAGGTPTALATDSSVLIDGFSNDITTGDLAVSADGKYIIGEAGVTGPTNFPSSELYLVSLDTPGTPTTLVPTADGALYGGAFTADSSQVLYASNVISGAGEFYSKPVAGGDAKKLGTTVWVWFTGLGTKVVFNDNYQDDSSMKTHGAADIFSVDAANPGQPKLIATQVDADFYISHGRDTIVYLDTATSGKEGIYTTTIP